jgi:hypothetical protein
VNTLFIATHEHVFDVVDRIINNVTRILMISMQIMLVLVPVLRLRHVIYQAMDQFSNQLKSPCIEM